MKNLVILTIVAALAYFGYVVWLHREMPVALPTEPVTSSTSPPSPAPPSEPPATTTTQRNIAPEGTFFLLQRISVTTDSGISGIPPGTKVNLVTRRSTGLRVTNGQQEFDVTASQITNDIDLAQQVFNANRAAHAQSSAIRAQQARDYQRQQEEALTSQQAANAPQIKTPAASAPSRGRYIPGVETQSSGLERSTGLGAGHTRTKDGYLWQKTPNGEYWVTVKRLDGRSADGERRERVQ